jgi:hypothetical protein
LSDRNARDALHVVSVLHLGGRSKKIPWWDLEDAFAFAFTIIDHHTSQYAPKNAMLLLLWLLLFFQISYRLEVIHFGCVVV